MYRIIVLFSIYFVTKSYAQIEMGSWRFHVNSKKAIDVVASEKYIYCALENGLLQYDPENIDYGIGTRVNGLSDIKPSKLFYLSNTDELVIGYENGNLDFVKGDEVENLPAIALASIPNSKKINSFFFYENYLYAATDFAIVKIDPVKKEIKDTYYPTNSLESLLDLYIHNDTVFALSPSRLLYGLLTNPALPDQSQWVLDNRVPIQLGSRQYSAIEYFENKLCVLDKSAEWGTDSVFIYENGIYGALDVINGSIEINSISQSGGKLFLNNAGSIYLFDENLNLTQTFSSFNIGTWFSSMQSTYGPNGLWSADMENGLVFFPNSFDFQPVAVTGTANSFFYSMDWADNRLAIASGYLLNKLPAFTKNGAQFFTDNGSGSEDWTYKGVYSTPCWDTSNIWDFLDVSLNPKNIDMYALSTYSEVPLTVFSSDSCFIYDESNSTLVQSSVGNGWTLVSDVCFDDDENLWCLNGYSDKPLNVFSTDGEWSNFDLGFNAKNKYTKKMIIDFQDNIWCATENAGLFGFNYGDNIDNISDDRTINLTTGIGQGNLPSNNITAIAADFDGEIWIGTDAGFAILYGANSSYETGADIDAQRVKINFEGNVEYVLGSTHITDIEVDGGNRKWLGTATSGIILLSSDGTEIIDQFTTENSPLISDVIYDLKLNQNTGELFIITDKGLISFRTNSSYEDPTYASCKVFPNPVRPNYQGPITIQGIRYNSDVKVTDASGNVVYKTTSNGGTATWDGKTVDGVPVASGIYYFWTARNEGRGQKVGKVAIIR
jgi:hypothetical protein